MKCPKCGYIGFEAADRCRNCGFDFSLVPVGTNGSELLLRPGEASGPLGDFDLGDARRPDRSTPATRASRRRQDATLNPGVPSPTPSGGMDLPLFGELPPDDAPLVRPSAPVPPLAVRRSTPPPSKVRTRSTPQPMARQEDLALLPVERSEPGRGQGRTARADAAEGAVPGLASRAGAAFLDWTILLGLDAGVLYFTLRVCRLAPAEVVILPAVPLLAFIALLNGSYLALLTAAGGQTIGKMAFGLRVVAGDDGPVTVTQAVLRTVALLVGALAAGTGLLPAVFDQGRRGLHDRLARTRVIRSTTS
jgi:uncharacterized RDD family membrane protein YckC